MPTLCCRRSFWGSGKDFKQMPIFQSGNFRNFYIVESDFSEKPLNREALWINQGNLMFWKPLDLAGPHLVFSSLLSGWFETIRRTVWACLNMMYIISLWFCHWFQLEKECSKTILPSCWWSSFGSSVSSSKFVSSAFFFHLLPHHPVICGRPLNLLIVPHTHIPFRLLPEL